MFCRAARGRVGPNSRSVPHMAIFLLNPYGLCACILVPKWLASSPKGRGRYVPLPRAAAYANRSSIFDRRWCSLRNKIAARRLQDIIWPSTPHFWHWLASSPQAEALYANRCWRSLRSRQTKAKTIDFYRKI